MRKLSITIAVILILTLFSSSFAYARIIGPGAECPICGDTSGMAHLCERDDTYIPPTPKCSICGEERNGTHDFEFAVAGTGSTSYWGTRSFKVSPKYTISSYYNSAYIKTQHFVFTTLSKPTSKTLTYNLRDTTSISTLPNDSLKVNRHSIAGSENSLYLKAYDYIKGNDGNWYPRKIEAWVRAVSPSGKFHGKRGWTKVNICADFTR